MIILLLQKYLKKRSAELMLVMGVLLFTLQTTPLHCGECLVGECSHTTASYGLVGDAGCHEPIQENKCCNVGFRAELKTTDSAPANCPSCNCILIGAIDDQTKVTLTPSPVPLRILFVSRFSDSLHYDLNFISSHRMVISQPKFRPNPIFLINSTYLI